jgi:hypothetical protein
MQLLIRAPIFLLAAGDDEIVPADQLFAMARLSALRPSTW